MKKNVGSFDGMIRSRLGMILILIGVLGFFEMVKLGLTVNIVLLGIGAVLFITGRSRRCGVYSVFGIDTIEPDDSE